MALCASIPANAMRAEPPSLPVPGLRVRLQDNIQRLLLGGFEVTRRGQSFIPLKLQKEEEKEEKEEEEEKAVEEEEKEKQSGWKDGRREGWKQFKEVVRSGYKVFHSTFFVLHVYKKSFSTQRDVLTKLAATNSIGKILRNREKKASWHQCRGESLRRKQKRRGLTAPLFSKWGNLQLDSRLLMGPVSSSTREIEKETPLDPAVKMHTCSLLRLLWTRTGKLEPSLRVSSFVHEIVAEPERTISVKFYIFHFSSTTPKK
ncbi:Hypothetical predicted protein [Xyrichtys novacula]|uniref:Uncharacterized protein n=1 Tax=Xyrichtys novacula TaxID=13765 RepID=A0AAV1FIQ1_XYRNO|nr:Hypothetical predicted protein [Xyrichtys novacula]